MKKIHFMNLSNKAIKSLMKIASFKKYSEKSELYYEGQTPIVAYFIIRGSILLIKNKEVFHKITKDTIIGYREFVLNIPSMFTAKILRDTEICYIDKSTLIEIRDSKDTEMRQLYEELTSETLQNKDQKIKKTTTK